MKTLLTTFVLLAGLLSVGSAYASRSFEFGYTYMEDSFGWSFALQTAKPIYEHPFFTVEAGIDVGSQVVFVSGGCSYYDNYSDNCVEPEYSIIFDSSFLGSIKLWADTAITENFVAFGVGPRIAVQEGFGSDVVTDFLGKKLSAGAYFKRAPGLARVGGSINYYFGASVPGYEPPALLQFALSVKF